MASSEWSASIDAFLQYARIERGLAANTISAYSRDLERLLHFVTTERIPAPKRLTRSHLQRFTARLDAEGLAPRSRARALSAVRRLVAFLHARGQGPAEDPFDGVRNPKLPRALPKTLSPAESAALLEAASGQDAREAASPLALRDRAMMEVLYGAGLRVSELVGLPLAAVDAHAGVLRVRGKGSKERLVPIGEAALGALEDYLEHGRPALLAGHARRCDAVFVTRRGAAMTRQNFFTRLKALARKANLPADRVSPHVLRHAFATDLLNGGADLRAVQEMLGHSDLSTTEIYTHVSRAKLRDTVEAHHPRGGGGPRGRRGAAAR